MEKKLAIIGHPLEGDKVIEILKMLGGRDAFLDSEEFAQLIEICKEFI